MAEQRPALEAIGMAGPVMVTVGDAEKMTTFLDNNPEIPRELLFADASESFDAYAAAGFGKIGEQGEPTAKLRAPTDVPWLKYLGNVGKVMPTIEGFGQVPEGVLRLGGTFVLDAESVLFGWADEIPGDHPEVEDVLRAAGVGEALA